MDNNIISPPENNDAKTNGTLFLLVIIVAQME